MRMWPVRSSLCLLTLLAGCGSAPADDDAADTDTVPVMEPFALSGPVTVQLDDSGIPHITASTEEDAFWAQGYFTARDRMWQMDYQRRRARGQLAEVLGESFLDSDVLMRGLNFGRWGDEAAEALLTEDPELARYFEAYATGVSQYLQDAIAGRYGLSLSPQLQALDYVPEPWTAADCLAVEKLLTGGLSMRPDVDLIIGLLNSTFEPDFFEDVYRYEGLDTTSVVPDYFADRAPVEPPASGDGRQRVQDLLSGLEIEDAVALSGLSRELALGNSGSNSFMVAGTR